MLNDRIWNGPVREARYKRVKIVLFGHRFGKSIGELPTYLSAHYPVCINALDLFKAVEVEALNGCCFEQSNRSEWLAIELHSDQIARLVVDGGLVVLRKLLAEKARQFRGEILELKRLRS